MIFILSLAVVVLCSCIGNGTSIKEVPVEQNDFQKITESVSVEDDQDLKSEIAERALFLCKYIPDHGIREGAEVYMTAEYYGAYTEAINAPRTTFDMGDDMFLYIFINDGEDEPVFSIVDSETDVKLVDNTHATVRVSIKDMYTNEPYMGSEFSVLTIEKVDGKWVIADFNDTKRDCIGYSKSVREEFKSGKAEDNLRMEGADDEFIENFSKDVEEFYRIYGEN